MKPVMNTAMVFEYGDNSVDDILNGLDMSLFVVYYE